MNGRAIIGRVDTKEPTKNAARALLEHADGAVRELARLVLEEHEGGAAKKRGAVIAAARELARHFGPFAADTEDAARGRAIGVYEKLEALAEAVAALDAG